MASLSLVLFIGAPIVFLFLEKPLGLVTKVRDKFDRLYVLRAGFSLYNLFSFFGITGVWAYMLMYAPQVFAQYSNPVTAFYLNGHWLSWLAVLGVVTVVGHFDIIKGAYAGAFVYSVHELTWITFAGVYNNLLIAVYAHYAVALIVMVTLLVSYFAAFRGLPRHKEVLVFSVMLIFDVMWVLAGFHAAVNNWLPNPVTPYFNDQFVGVIEVLGWVLPSLVVIL